MPDDSDYEWLGWLIDHPEAWTGEDLAAARSMISNQKRAIADLHARDEEGRRSMQSVVDELEAAVRAHATGSS